MKNLYVTSIDDLRLRTRQVEVMYGGFGDGKAGAFVLRSPIDQADLFIIASCGDGWEHVSVSRSNRCPNWIEMEFVKRTFFEPEEVAVEFHVPESKHINAHPHCLHLWRLIGAEFPMPPQWMVGP